MSIKFPFVALIISGGHTSLFYLEDFHQIKLIGATQDDACGEAFDKVAKILGLGYPGGPLIERLAKKGDPKKIKFACSGTRRPLDFSFSGIKTAVLYKIKNLPQKRDPARGGKKSKFKNFSGEFKQASIPDLRREDIAASFQEAVLNTLIEKSLLACRMKKTKILVVGGGVAANNRLREKFYQEIEKRGIKCYFPSLLLCLDNAAMVAGLGYQLFKKGCRSDLTLTADFN